MTRWALLSELDTGYWIGGIVVVYAMQILRVATVFTHTPSAVLVICFRKLILNERHGAHKCRGKICTSLQA